MRRALDHIALDTSDVVVILSPHGSSTGVYRSLSGTLDEFGLSGFGLQRATEDRVAKTLAYEWKVPILDAPLDHGVTVPLLLHPIPEVPVVAATIREWASSPGGSLEAALHDAHSFAAALTRLSSVEAISFVASAHTSAALSSSAPLTFREEGSRLHHTVCEAIRFGWSLHDVPIALWQEAGACGAGPLVAFGRTMSGREGQLLSFDRSVGVGYVVATVR